MTTSFVDLPRRADEKDSFGITKYEEGLVSFLQDVDTPLTLALQGEWGSGKTSLMNLLKQRLCDDEGSQYIPIMINTWEFGLLSDPAMTLVSILEKMISMTSAYAKTGSGRAKAWLGKITRASVRFAGNMLGEGSGDALIEELASGGDESRSNVSILREELQSYVDQALLESDPPKKGFIFFIDDLDRINPSVAVELLELLKNIFSLKKCVFILAIDYDVVVKGLKPKFGELTDKNEREFRSFFDKIIQVPFAMPVNNYEIGGFLMEELGKIAYLSGEQLKKKSLKKSLSFAANTTVGTNPRALKRLLNTLSLIRCINGRQGEKSVSEHLQGNPDLYVLLNFSVVAIQVAYPKLYRLLAESPGFDTWGEAEALRFRLPSLSEDIKKELRIQEEFDEEWEQIIFRFCETDPYLKKRAGAISKLFNTMKSAVRKAYPEDNNEKDESIYDIISEIVKLSAVTSFDAGDSNPVQYHIPSLLKTVQWGLIRAFRELRPDIVATSASRRVQKNAVIRLEEKSKEPTHIWINSESLRSNIEVSMWLEQVKAFPLDKITDLDDFKSSEYTDPEFQKIAAEYNDIAMRCNDIQGLTCPLFVNIGFSDKTYHWWRFKFGISGRTPEDFDDPDYHKVLAEVILKALALRERLETYYQKAFQQV